MSDGTIALKSTGEYCDDEDDDYNDFDDLGYNQLGSNAFTDNEIYNGVSFKIRLVWFVVHKNVIKLELFKFQQ